MLKSLRKDTQEIFATESHSESDLDYRKILRRHFGSVEEPGYQGYLLEEYEPPFPPPKTPSFKFIDLFAGIGGFRLAMQELGGRCVFSSEWDQSAKRTYYRNFGEVPFGDISQFTTEKVTDRKLKKLIPDHNIICAGFPCQPFSLAGVSSRNSLGKSHGFKCETQGTLFFDIARIASVKKPDFMILENVANLLNHDGGRTFSVISETVQSLGYHFSYAILDARSIVPQKRRRCFMICSKKSAYPKIELPIIEGKPIPLKTVLEKRVPSKYTISDKLWAGHKRRTKVNLARGTGFTAFSADLNKPANTLVARYGKDGKECLIPQNGKNPRKLTPRECARLQGFPENYILPESDAASYRQFGNSVPVPLVRLVLKQIEEFIK